MTIPQTSEPAPRKALRLWPGVLAVALQWLAWLVIPLVVPQWGGSAMLVALFLGPVVIVWWLVFSRAAWLERLGVIAMMVAAVAATSYLVHESIANGMMGMMLFLYAIPAMSLALVAGSVASRGPSSGRRLAAIAAAVLVACGTLTIVRTNGITGDADSDLQWRWTPTAEQRLLASADAEPLDSRSEPAALPAAPPAAAASEDRPAAADSDEGALLPAAPPAAAPSEEPLMAPAGDEPEDSAVTKTAADWPGFRGPGRDSVIRGVRIETDWSRTPPLELWRHPIGPGWSSFAVHGDRIFTQEQRGDDEVVSSYRLSTGEPVWRHSDAVRFWESNGGAGPRGTPTVRDGRVFTMGATGVVNALDAGNGAVLWSRNAAADTGKTVPDWGIASSPLVVDDLVVVAVAGQLAAYDIATGSPRWLGAAGGGGYSSPHFATIDGVPQILLLRGARTISVAPDDGALLWEHSAGQAAVSILQPALAADGNVLIPAGDAMGGSGMRRVAVAHGSDGWTVEERWTSRGLKPYFNDFVVHKDHAFGFDGSILSCIDLEDGERKWKGGRYGHGQLVLLPDQDVLLVLSEDGELALVSATSDKFTELARFPAMDAKTWNHPVLVGDVLLVRNGEEMAAFRVPLASR